MRRFIHRALGSLAVLLWIASLCRGAPIRDTKSKPPPSSFTWEAFIHGPTGEASSNERSGPFSLATIKPSLWSLLRKRISNGGGESSSSLSIDQDETELKEQLVREEEHLIVETSRQFVDAWSAFLCQGSISLGILRCEKEKNDSKKTKRGWRKLLKPKRSSIAVQDNCTALSSSSLLARFTTFPVKLLTFGSPVESSCSSFIYQDGVEDTNQNSTVILGSWDIPLEGGALLLGDDELQEQKSRSKGKYECRGKLMFAIVKKTGLTDKSEGDDSIESLGDSSSYEIITGIRNYQPWLAGGGYTDEKKKHDNIWDALKANRETTTRRLCHGFYLSTQSMVHAYVTWRFHHAWKKELTAAVRTTTKTAPEKESS